MSGKVLYIIAWFLTLWHANHCLLVCGLN